MKKQQNKALGQFGYPVLMKLLFEWHLSEACLAHSSLRLRLSKFDSTRVDLTVHPKRMKVNFYTSGAVQSELTAAKLTSKLTTKLGKSAAGEIETPVREKMRVLPHRSRTGVILVS